LVQRAQQGDGSAFEQLYWWYLPRVYGLCLRLVADPVQAEILTQDVFVRAWQKLTTFAGRGSFAGWLRRLTVNVVVEDRRAASRRNRRFEAFEEMDGPDETGVGARGTVRPQVGAEPKDLVGTETNIDLDRALLTLPFGARFAFVLHDVMGYPHQEIAAMTGMAVGTVKAQLHRARRLLRKKLTD
jgi:RNA polymerase sigma-70 factor (ECF subfamily)